MLKEGLMRINIKDYTGGMFYTEAVEGYNNGFWSDVEELKEFCENKGMSVPSTAHGCKRQSPELSAYSVIEELEAEYADNIEDGELDDTVKTAVQEWVRLLNRSLEKDHSCHWFICDETVEVVLEEPYDYVVGKKPKEKPENRGFYGQWECPTCGSDHIQQGGHYCNYCDSCGTKIDWSDIE